MPDIASCNDFCDGDEQRTTRNDECDGDIDKSEDESATVTVTSETDEQLFSRRLSQAEQNLESSKSPLYKVVLTGGPCGGKTTALARLSSYLRERGFEVLTCPEAFSILISNGMSMEYYGIGGMGPVVQHTVMDLQISLEDGFERILRARGRPSVLLCDRGLMDGSAYMTQDEWEQFMSRRNVQSESELREGRYNAVFHLVTAAEGAERYYTLENNAVRTETPEKARRVDVLTRTAWVGHPKLCVFDNSTDFEGKLQRLVDATAKLVGLPSSLSRQTTKFLLRGKPNLELFPTDVKYHIFEVEKVYLYDEVQNNEEKKYGENETFHLNDTSTTDSSSLPSRGDYAEEYSFIRKRSHIDKKTGRTTGSVYGQTTVKRTHDGQVIEVKRIITSREYASAFKTRDMNRHVVRQTRISFLWKMQSFNIHMYTEPVKDLCILHAQTEINPDDFDSDGRLKNGVFEIPPFLDVERRLSNTPEDNETYGAFNISLMKKE